MRCGIAKTVTRVGNTSPDHCRYGIGYLLARSVLYEALAVLAAAYPSDVILVSHIHTLIVECGRWALLELLIHLRC